MWELVWRIISGLKNLYDMLPQRLRDWLWQIVALLITEVLAVWSTVRSQPPHVVFLVSLWALATVSLVMHILVGLYFRVTLNRLLRTVTALLEEGQELAAHLIESTWLFPSNVGIWAGHAAHVDRWRHKVQEALRDDPRLGSYRDALQYSGRHQTLHLLATLQAIRTDLEQRKWATIASQPSAS